MLHFEGIKDLPHSPDAVWSKLRSAGFLVQSIPGVESVKQTGSEVASCVIRPGFSFVRGTLEVTIQIAEATQPTMVRLAIASKSIGSSSQVDARINISGQDSGTRVEWSADVTELGGLLKAVPQGLLKASAQKVIGDVWSGVESKLAAMAC
jgi:carbon monoxide dehydrogenase subunit G